MNIEIRKTQTLLTFGRYEAKRECTSDPGARAKLRNEEIAEAFNFFLNAIVSLIALKIRRTSRA